MEFYWKGHDVHDAWTKSVKQPDLSRVVDPDPVDP